MATVTVPGTAADWAAVYEANAARLIRLATLLVGPTDAYDLVADTVLRTVSSGGWTRVTSQSAYLTRALVNLAHDRRIGAARRRHRELREASLFSSTVASPESDVDRRLAVGALLESLSTKQLAVVHLHYWEDLTLDQVADQLSMSPGSVRRHLDRAKRTLRAELSSDQGVSS